MAGRWPIDDVLARTDLAALLDEFAVPAQQGRRWHCPLPDHDDHHASVTMRRDHRGHERWRCWSGDHRGDAVDLIQAVRGCGRADAIDELATRAGMFPDRDLPPIPQRRPAGPAPATEPDPMVIAYSTMCARLLWGPLGAGVRDWLHARGLDDDVLHANHVGADPGRARLARGRGMPYGYGPGATFPALDASGRIRYVQTRALEQRPGRGKYDNPSAVRAPNPRLSHAHPPRPSGSGRLLVCEGIPDALIAAQAGHCAIGLLGSDAVNATTAARIANHAQVHGLDVVIVTDHDPAGLRAGVQLADQLAGHATPTRRVHPPEGHDLTSWALQNPTWAASLPGADVRSVDTGPSPCL